MGRVLTRGGYSYRTSKELVKRARQLAGLERGRDRRDSVDRLTEEVPLPCAPS